MAPRTPATRTDQHAGPQARDPQDVAVSEEGYASAAPGVELCYQTFGDPADDPLLLVMGLGGPMIWWDEDLCRRLAAAGFYVVRYDNRDVGRSSRLPGRVTRTMLLKAFAGRPVRAPYAMADLADDGFAVLDHLGVDRAHVAGVSMGGMIVQTMAIAHPERVLSLTSIMSTLGKRSVGWQDPVLLPMLLARRRPGREAYVESSEKMWSVIGSPGYQDDEEVRRARAGDTFDRGVSTGGVLRQMLAILTQPNRTAHLRDVRVPALVIHGDSDKMVHVSGGRATAQAIPGAELLLVRGMGHDMPKALFDTIVAGIRRTADRAKR